MTSALSIKCYEADNLVNGIYRCFVRGQEIVITDEVNEWVISKTDIDELEQAIESLTSDMETALDGKSDVGHTHSLDEVLLTYEEEEDGEMTTKHKGLDELLNDIETALNGKASSSHTHSIGDVSNLQTTLNSKSNVGHYHVFDDVFYVYEEEEEIEEDGETITKMITRTKGLEQVLNERENALKTLINGKSPMSHRHNATEIDYAENRSVKQEIDTLYSKISRTTAEGAAVDIADIIFGTAADVGLAYKVSELQTQMAAVQGQVAGLAGTYAVNNTTNSILETADELSEFSDVAMEGRNVMDGLDGYLNSHKGWLQNRTSGYNQLTNNYTSPALSSVNNAELLGDVDLTAFDLVPDTL